METLGHFESVTTEFVYLLCGLVEIRENLVCIAHIGVLDHMRDTKDGGTKWYHISKSEANKKIADICMMSISQFQKDEKRDTISFVEFDTTNRTSLGDHPLLLYAVDNWWTHANISASFSSSELPAELKSQLVLWSNTWRSVTDWSGQKTGKTESKRTEPLLLFEHVQSSIADCLEVIMAAERIPTLPNQDPWSHIILAALQWGKQKISTQLISRIDPTDRFTLLTIFQTCQESLLCDLPPPLKQFAEENLLDILSTAIHRGHEKLLQTLVDIFEANPIFNAKDTRVSLLNAYAKTGYLHPSLAKAPWTLASLQMKQDINTSAYRPLHSAAISGHIVLIKTMIQWGINLDRVNDRGETALLLACRYGHYSIVKLLLEAGASYTISADNKSSPALYEACTGGYVDIVRLFVGRSAFLFGIGPDQKTPLHVALDHGHSQIATLLVSSLSISSTTVRESSSSPNRHLELDQQDAEGRTPLIAAVEWNNLPLVKALMQCGVKLELQDASGRSAIHYALKYGYFDIAIHILNNTNTGDKEQRRHILKFPHDLTVRSHVRVLKELLDKIPPSPEIKNDLELALTKAVEWGQTDAARLLLLHNDHKIPTSLISLAARSGYVETVLLLLDCGADINAQDDDTDESSLLHIAAANRHSLLIRDLLLRGVTVNTFNADGQTPLLAAVTSGSTEIVEMLLKAGAYVNTTDSYGHTPLDSAASAGYAIMFSLLLRANASQNSLSQHSSKLENLLDFVFLNSTNEVVSVLMHHSEKRVSGPRLALSDATLQEFITTPKYNPERLCFLETFLSHGQDINADIGKYGGLLHYAAGWGRLELVGFLIQPRKLIQVEIDMPNKRGETPLQLAATMCGGDDPAAIISALLSQGANTRLRGPKYISVLHAAVNKYVYKEHDTDFSKSSAVVKRLLKHDEQAMQVVGGDQGSVLQSAVMGGNPAMVDLLFTHGAHRVYSDLPCGRHGTPIHAAVHNPHNHVVDLLVSLRISVRDFESKDQEGRLPLHIAASRLLNSDFSIIHNITRYGNTKQRDFQGRTALHFAAGKGQTANIETILQKDPELLYEADDDGWTPLHWACRDSDTSTIQLLLDKGASVTEVTRRGWLPRDVAVWHDSVGISMVETVEQPTPSIDASVLDKCDVETVDRVKMAARLASWSSLMTNETMASARCDSCECSIYGTRYTCQTCWDMDYCFKCFRHIELFQHHKNHIFTKLDADSKEIGIINPWEDKNKHGESVDCDPSTDIQIGNSSSNLEPKSTVDGH